MSAPRRDFLIHFYLRCSSGIYITLRRIQSSNTLRTSLGLRVMVMRLTLSDFVLTYPSRPSSEASALNLTDTSTPHPVLQWIPPRFFPFSNATTASFKI
ncbi:hypothetical protein CDAR_522771 [Caerostris darwini]|uniref:Uncharacterized protein n=1 Tax=Caerostris darwini TaxID=1538125 RepID=A0AAV4U9M9_9ARAC|nr:hypothetical protein CDAR_522771 [Caerostris darwini]